MISASAMAPEADRTKTRTVGLIACTPTLMKKNDKPQISPRAAKAAYGSRPCRRLPKGSDTSRPVIRREHERDRAVVFDVHPHHRSKATGTRLYSAVAKTLHERLVELLGACWIPGAQKARAPAPAHVREQRELGHD